MSGNVVDYDPKQVVCTWTPLSPGIGAIALNEGISEGTFLLATREVKVFKKKIGSDGEGTRIRSNNKSGSITATLRAGSSTNDKPSTVLEVAESTGLGNLGPILMKDFTGRTLVSSPQAYIEGWPGPEFADDETENVWVLICHNLIIFRGGNRDAA